MAATSTATLGASAPVATDVAIAFALSWKPFVKSKNSAVTITKVTRNNVVVIDPSPSTADVHRTGRTTAHCCTIPADDHNSRDGPEANLRWLPGNR